MVPQRLEYMMLLAVLGVLLFAFLGRPIRNALRERAYWISLAIFMIVSIALDAWAIAQGWWSFFDARLVGLTIATVPIEEYVLIAGFHALVIGLWKIDQ